MNYLGLIRENVEAFPPPPAKFTYDDWYFDTRQKFRCTEDQQQLSDRILSESDRLRDETNEKSVNNKKEVDFRIGEKITDIKFYKTELERQRQLMNEYIESLNVYSTRISHALRDLDEKAVPINRKCIILREGRLGIDLCLDDVDKELLKEKTVIEGCSSLLRRTLEQATEQCRRLRATTYFLDRDHEGKTKTLNIEEYNLKLDPASLSLSIFQGTQKLDPANITYGQWLEFTNTNIETAAKEVNSAKAMNSAVDTILKQATSDLWEQYHSVNEALQKRIGETKEAKMKLEIKHSEAARQANEMSRNIARIEKSLKDQENYLALAHTRLGNRAQRQGIELCKDPVEGKLMAEVADIQENVEKLMDMLSQSQASLRYLLRTQIQLEEDINVRANTLKIDEVDLMGLRHALDYHAY